MEFDQVFAKVILSGEHSVLRGGAAVVAPLKSQSLKYNYSSSNEFKIEYNDETSPYEILIEGTIDRALSLLDKKRVDLKLKIELLNLVPLGKGLGGSAALSVFVSRLMGKSGFIEKDQMFSFSKNLEDMFHGESSGVDIAGCLSSGPHLYVRGEKLLEVKPQKNNLIFGLVDTDESSDTEECIEKVLSLKKNDKKIFYELDSEMDEASRELYKALEEADENSILNSIKKARGVFDQWGLISSRMKEIESELLSSGALALKPTGSGLGGYMLGVWMKDFEDVCRQKSAMSFVI